MKQAVEVNRKETWSGSGRICLEIGGRRRIYERGALCIFLLPPVNSSVLPPHVTDRIFNNGSVNTITVGRPASVEKTVKICSSY